MVGQFRPCPLCGGSSWRWQFGGESYKRTSCDRCGTFVVDPTLSWQSGTRRAPKDVHLMTFLPVYIRHQNRHDHVPLITLRNWRTLAQCGRLLTLRNPQPAMEPQESSAKSEGRKVGL